MLDFDENEVVLLKKNGEEHKVRKPSNGDIEEYSDSLEECKSDKDKKEALVCFLEKLGLKREIYFSLTPSQLKAVLESLYEAEKN